MADQKKPAPFNNPFAALQGKLGALPPGPEPREKTEKPAERKNLRAVVQRERKGHGGKEMTRVTQLAANADEAQALSDKLKKQLGCGGTSEGCDILLQGDQRERLRPLLASLGVTRLTFGN